MWNLFKRLQPEPITNRYKTLDWSQVTTLEEVIYILSKMRLTKNIMIDEDCWNDPKIKNLLGKDITETTYIGFEKTTKFYKE
jgi:hypothetical protein